ncbi:cell wall-binding repeat-containing protein [Candidatus Poriferisodalis sp.]|uniref:cell wall-binding repeat-containing protein n=1 Tax=Candidatus Poriferisodalis sp. TaxID=3101277 RepID=UPI003B52EA04
MTNRPTRLHRTSDTPVERELAALGPNVTRLGGATRFETATATADFVEARYSSAAPRCFDRATAGLATALVPFDSFSAAPLLAALCAPLLLTERDPLHPSTSRWLRTSTEHIIVLGGNSAVSQTATDTYLSTGETAQAVVQYRTGDTVAGFTADSNPDFSTLVNASFDALMAGATADDSVAMEASTYNACDATLLLNVSRSTITQIYVVCMQQDRDDIPIRGARYFSQPKPAESPVQLCQCGCVLNREENIQQCVWQCERDE